MLPSLYISIFLFSKTQQQGYIVVFVWECCVTRNLVCYSLYDHLFCRYCSVCVGVLCNQKLGLL